MTAAILMLALLAQAPTYTVDELLSYAFPTSATVSQDGTHLVWVERVNGAANLHAAAAPDWTPRKLTDYQTDDGITTSVIGFTPNGKTVLFLRNNAINATSDIAGASGGIIYSVPFAGGPKKKVITGYSAALSPTQPVIAYNRGGHLNFRNLDEDNPFDKIQVRGSLGGFSFSPDGKTLLFTSSRESYDHNYAFVMTYNLETKELTYLDPSVYMDYEPSWSPDGTKIAYTRRIRHEPLFVLGARTFPQPDPYEFRLHDLSTNETRTLWASPEHDTTHYARFAWLDSKRMVFISEKNGWRNLYSLDMNGKVEDLLVGDFIVEDMTVDRAKGAVYVVTNKDDIDRRHIWRIKPGEDPQQLHKGAEMQWDPKVLKDGLAWIKAGPKTPPRLTLSVDSKERLLTPIAKQFPLNNMVVPEQAVFKAADGQTVHGQLFLPPASFKGKRPAVMFFHGGPIRQMLLGWHYSGYYSYCYAFNQMLASRGYVVLSVNFRLGIGYGRAFRDVSDGGPRGASEYQDLLAGARFLRGHDRVDPERMGLWGGSYGGLMTALGLARNSDLFKAGVDLHGVHDWNQWQSWVQDQPFEDNRTAWKSSPIADLDSWRSPVLLVHADDDRNVPFSETIWLFKELKKRAVEAELMVIPNDVHSFLLHDNWAKIFKRAATFFDKHLSP